MEGSKRKHDSR
ncbi:Cytoplasmic protein, partial [Monkeypox virus]